MGCGIGKGTHGGILALDGRSLFVPGGPSRGDDRAPSRTQTHNVRKSPCVGVRLLEPLLRASTVLGVEVAHGPQPFSKLDTRGANDYSASMITTTSGLQYEDTRAGDGAEAVAGKTCVMHYTGWLWEEGKKGSKFDSSVDRGQPFSFRLGAGQVIRGWDEGVAGIKIGGKRTLLIPSELGYGARGAGGVIPPNATLLFEVELLDLR